MFKAIDEFIHRWYEYYMVHPEVEKQARITHETVISLMSAKQN